MLYPVTRPARVPKLGTSNSTTTATTPPAAQSASHSQPMPRTADQDHAGFESAKAALDSMGTMGRAIAQLSRAEAQADGGHQAASAYAQFGQPPGQFLDITA
jgi:hypothetical protein